MIIELIKKGLVKMGVLKKPFYTKDIFKHKKYHIGDYTYGEPNIMFENPEANLYIGKFCSIAQNVSIFLGGNHRIDWITSYPFPALTDYFPSAKGIKGHPSTKGDVIIGNDVWIGYNSIILSGVSIGNGAVIGAGSIVSKNIGAYEIWSGNPAKFIKKRFDDEKISIVEKSDWWNWSVEKINQNIETLCCNNLDLLNKKNIDL